MFCKISHNVKIAALNLHENGVLTLPDILASVGFSESTFYCVLWLWKETGDIVSHWHANKARRPHLLHFDDIQYLLHLVQHQPDWFLDELPHLLNKTTLYLFTMLLFTGNWNMLECLVRSSRLLQRNIMNHLKMIICDTWHSTVQNSSDSLMRLPRMTKLLVDNMAEEAGGDRLRWSRCLSKVANSLLKVYWQWKKLWQAL